MAAVSDVSGGRRRHRRRHRAAGRTVAYEFAGHQCGGLVHREVAVVLFRPQHSHSHQRARGIHDQRLSFAESEFASARYPRACGLVESHGAGSVLPSKRRRLERRPFVVIHTQRDRPGQLRPRIGARRTLEFREQTRLVPVGTESQR
jgi:hypothetical protein